MPDVGFHTVLLEGLFYLEDRTVMVDGRAVDDVLAPLHDQHVQLAMHHLPPTPPDPTRWGFGCCHWQPHGHCPFGHHGSPMTLFQLAGEGILVCYGSNGWRLDRFGRPSARLPFVDAFWGHHARILAATVRSEEQMRSAVGQADVGTMATKVADLTRSLERLKGGT